MKIAVVIEQGPPPTTAPEYRRSTIEQQVKQAIENVECDQNTQESWNFLRGVNNSLQRRARKSKLSSRAENVLRMIQPVMEKLGQHDPRGIEMDAVWRTVTDRDDSRKKE